MVAQVTFEASFVTKQGTLNETVNITKAVVGGWTGRDKAALQHHIDELAKLGVSPPERTPLFYRVGVSRITFADAIEVIGDESSGEVEYVLLKSGGRIWVGAGSDHTDRAIEHVGISVAKQLCDKPIARTFWPLDEVSEHWHELVLRSWLEEDDGEVLYQDGSVALLLTPNELLAAYEATGECFENGTLMFGGTCGAIGEIRHTPRFKFELRDPVLSRVIEHTYNVTPVPIMG